MEKYNVSIIIDAANSVEVWADSPEAAAEAAYDHEAAHVTLCHQCSSDVGLGDAVRAIVYNADNTKELYDDGRVTAGPDPLREIVRKFIVAQRVSSPECIYQSDRVIENAYGFVEELVAQVGYYDTDTEQIVPAVPA